MREVAAAAGVSIKTVSRVVNQEPGVTAAVRDRVLAAVDRLDYRHNLAASNLRRLGAPTGVVGVLVQDVANSYSATLIRALEDALRPRGVMLLCASMDETAVRERRTVENLIARRVDGLVIVPATANQDYLEPEVRAGLPVIIVDRAPHGIETDSVTVDNAGGAHLAVRHLLAQGHRRIAVISDNPSIRTAAERICGARRAFAEFDAQLPADLLRTGVREDEQAAAVVHELLAAPRPPTALFTARNVLTAGAMQALTEAGMRERVALVGFDDFPLARLLGLTVVRQDVWRVGQLVGERLIARLTGDDSPPQRLVLDPVLVARGSGEVSPPRG